MAILFEDINEHLNIAAKPMNHAARIMSLADPKQVFLSGRAYLNLTELSGEQDVKAKFRRYSKVKVKHETKITVYQYLGDAPAISISAPSHIESWNDSSLANRIL